ncbi:patatin-like phospholipase family protein [Roseiconus nitratireducens]|uniref:Patatin-like phospholipase family protein n=1 Tax=Roseiconus nitratireducens TaxID=2605748 RepID=A0A5M6D3S1_9BACT|nr:patatin-like phospholipase family protein [Roseiconus nitratireducens]KAA5542134.1 patatin-like phospholipase family protein [Roseiconus nitratireducens]
MSTIGLALSGGGFRATLFHLGIIRYLRDANQLSRVSHLTSVSGGSIAAAHFVLNWDRYTGSEEQFDEAAEELLDFIRTDVRNRIVRRFPLALVGNGVRQVTGQGRKRQWSRPGLLEKEYEKHLFGDKCLYELPALPQLHMLATNINEGRLCSFTRRGLLVEKRQPGHGGQFELLPTRMATVPMAVAASSAFPGFFPPLPITANDVGFAEGKFPPHLFTDGGVYDNLGVRMFRHIQNSWIGHDTPLCAHDFVDLQAAAKTLAGAGASRPDALARLASLARCDVHQDAAADHQTFADKLPERLWSIIVDKQLYNDPAFADLNVDDDQVADLLRFAKRDRELEFGDHLWLNRSLMQAAFASAGQGQLFHATRNHFDAVIVSDAGRQLAVTRRTKAGGLVGVALRASDILMDRVWELECDTFHAEPDFLFAPISETVSLAEDPTALHPEIQSQVADIRTDLDRFSELEISGLVRHGYGVMRSVCRSRPDVFGTSGPEGPPWDPTQIRSAETVKASNATSPVTRQARSLHDSAQRQLFSHLFSFRDWPSYLYLPLVLAILIGGPILAYKAYQRAHRSEMIVDAITFSNPDFQHVLQLARQRSTPGEWTPLVAEEVKELKPVDVEGFRMITDPRVFDMRAWESDASDMPQRTVVYRRMQVRRIALPPETASEDAVQDFNRFRLRQFTLSSQAFVRCNAPELKPVLRFTPAVNEMGQKGFIYEIEFDLSSVPEGQDFDIGFEVTDTGIQGRVEPLNRILFPIFAPTDVASMWVFLPEGRPYRSFKLIGYDSKAPVNVESISPTYEFQMADGSLFGWMLVAPREENTYECRWT